EDDRLEQRPDGFFVMPVEQTSTSTQTNNRLFVSNLAFSASERDLLGAFRSVLRLSGAVPRGIRLFKDGRNKSRGIGLIEFDTADAATRALGVVDGQQVLGRKVRARRDRGASSSPPSSGSSSETPSGSASGAKRRRTDDGSGAAAAANAPQGATGDTEGSGNSVDVRCVQPEDQSCDTCDADGALEAEDQSPDTTPVAVKDGTLCSVVGTLDFGHVDHQNADIDVELCELGQGSVAGKPLTTVCSLVSVRAGYDTTNKVDWLLDSGCALHLIDKNTHPWLCNARSVLLPKPVRLIFANGTSQFVDEAKFVAFVYDGRRCYSHVLVVEGLTVSGILSLHQLANDFGTVAWHLNDDSGEVLRLGSHVVLHPRPSGPPQLSSAPISSPPLVEVFSTSADYDHTDDLSPSAQDAVEAGKADFLMNNIDRPPDTTASSYGESGTVKHLKVDYVQDDTGHSRARVGLPWLSDDRPDCNTPGLQSSVAAARDRVTCKKLASLGPEWLGRLSHELDDMVSQGHIRPLTKEEMLMNPPVMSAVVVLRPGHPTQPLRVTIDARPLNRYLGPGDTSILSQALQKVLLRWRLAPYTCWDDITRAFLQVLLPEEDSRFINFRINNMVFRCLRLPFGLVCSPAILSCVLENAGIVLSDADGSTLAAFFAYMDDLLYTSWSPDKLLERRSLGRKVLAERYRMECQPSKAILGYDPEFNVSQPQIAPTITTSTKPVKVLGYQWNLVEDSLSVILPDVSERPLRTRRDCFQTLGKYFDPLGIHIEAAARERWLLRQAAHSTASWDSVDVPTEVVQGIRALFDTKLPPQPRFADIRSGIVIYCDAAGTGCICADARAISSGRRIVARQRTLNPSWSIARLELCGLVLATELLSTILKEIDVVVSDGYDVESLWILTDSQLNAWRLRRSPALDAKYLPKFELRRMTKLRGSLRDMASYYRRDICIGSISGAENPADLGTRPGTNDSPAKMMLLSGKNIEVTLSKAKVISTFSVTATSGCDEVVDELDEALASADAVVNAVVDLHKDVPSLEPDEDLRRLLLNAQSSDPDLQGIFKKLKAADGVIDGYELYDGLIYRTGSVSLDDSGRGSCVCHQIVVPEVRRDLQSLVTKWVHDKHRGHPGRTTLTRWVWRSYYWKRLDRTVRMLNQQCGGCQARRIADNRRRTHSARPPGCSVKYEPFAIAYYDVMGPYQLSKDEGGDPKKLYIFTLSCHSSKFVKCEPAYSKGGESASRALLRLLTDEGPSRVLMVDQGLNVPEVMSVADEWDATVVAAPPRGEELRGWGERAHRDVHAVIRGCLWDLAADHKLPTEDEFLRILSRAVTIVNMTPYVDG
ncbi:hypothetical protein FOZ62_025913, partial [Perkinsus olseni]